MPMVGFPANDPATSRDLDSQAKLVLSLSNEHPKTPGFRLSKTGSR
jgi:hypothetical protein